MSKKGVEIQMSHISHEEKHLNDWDQTTTMPQIPQEQRTQRVICPPPLPRNRPHIAAPSPSTHTESSTVNAPSHKIIPKIPSNSNCTKISPNCCPAQTNS